MAIVSRVFYKVGNIAAAAERRVLGARPTLPRAPNPIKLADGIELIRKTDHGVLKRDGFISDVLLPTLGLNCELTDEQPRSLSEHFGGGFGWRIWQYPNQFQKYLLWLIDHAHEINSYVEIGTRFGGTFVVTCEILARYNPKFRSALAVDLIPEPELLRQYHSFHDFEYFEGSSSSEQFAFFVKAREFDLALIDGDHTIDGVLADFLIMRDRSKVLVFHDTVSVVCPGVVDFWKSAKIMLTGYRFTEFADQYDDVPAKGPFLGFGIASKLL